ncbi:hypothetical protein LCGC14_2541130, partial [marine sediment metagenome]
MKSISLNDGTVRKYFSDGKRIIPKAHLESVCNLNKEKTCKYIFLLRVGETEWKFACTKKTPVKTAIDAMFDRGQIVSKLD